ncbi:MAG: hypothetical protein IJB90_02790 [Clostridia bacterium]|nr:hypothetical protein [Clostridia bacterium]
MIDITKDEFWENRYGEVEKQEKKNSKLLNTIKKHKIITALLISLGILMAINTVLIYNFFKILTNI